MWLIVIVFLVHHPLSMAYLRPLNTYLLAALMVSFVVSQQTSYLS
jgi:hypothetical protein